MGLTERKRKQPKGKKPMKQPRGADGKFHAPKVDGKALGNNTQAGLDQARRLMQDVMLHGSRSQALDRLVTGEQAWSEALREWREAIVQDNGGWPRMSTETHDILAKACVVKVVSDSFDAYAVCNHPVNQVKRRAFGWVSEHAKLTVLYLDLIKRFRETMQQTGQDREPSLEDILSGDAE